MKNVVVTLAIIFFVISNVSAKPTCEQKLKKLKQDHELGYSISSQRIARDFAVCRYDDIYAEILYIKALWGYDKPASMLRELEVRHPDSAFILKTKKLVSDLAEADVAKKEGNREKYGVYAHLIESKEVYLYFDNDIILDTQRGLMWGKGPKEPTSWSEAKSYCDNYEGGGYKDWRMPTHAEIKRATEENFGRESKWIGKGDRLCKTWASETKQSLKSSNPKRYATLYRYYDCVGRDFETAGWTRRITHKLRYEVPYAIPVRSAN